MAYPSLTPHICDRVRRRPFYAAVATSGGRRHTRRRRSRPTSRRQQTSLMIRGRVFPSRVLASHERTTPATARTFRCSLVVILFFSSYVFGAQPLSLQVVHVACLGVRLDNDCTSLDYLSPHLKTRLPKEPPIDCVILLLVDGQGPLPEAQWPGLDAPRSSFAT